MPDTYAYTATSKARETLAMTLAAKDDSTPWSDWSDNDNGKGHWRRAADKLADKLRDAGYTVIDESGPVSEVSA